ncbi:MAG: GTPase [Candidatus Zixiibacteriota bacterium]
MPANLPPQYYELERVFKAERDPREKLRLAQELLAMMPKHKGTDKLQADLKSKISKLKKQLISGGNKAGAAKSTSLDHIDKEGAGQVALIGPPNSGKSSLVDALTNARPMIADYPYTTREPVAGMMPYETIQIQLIDTPPISPDMFEPWMLGIIRNADLICLVAGVGDDGFEERVQYVFDKLKERRVILTHAIPNPEDVDDPSLAYKRTIIAAHKFYDDGGGKRFSRFTELYPGFSVIGTSILDEETLERFKKMMFDNLNIMRVYTKTIGHEPDFTDPIIVPPGSTVEEAALMLHKDFAYKLQFAKIWGSGKYDGQRVQKSYVLRDKDIIEFHI